MPVEQGFPWHPVATGLAGQAIPFVVAAPWSPIPYVLVSCPCCLAPPASLPPPPSLSAALAFVPHGVAPTFCVAVLLPSVGAPGCPCEHPLLSHQPAPPHEDFTSPHNLDCLMCGWLVTALLPPPWRAPPSVQGAVPALVEFAGTLWREGGAWLLMIRRIRWLLRCSHLVVPPCHSLCLVGARLITMCGAALSPRPFYKLLQCTQLLRSLCLL